MFSFAPLVDPDTQTRDPRPGFRRPFLRLPNRSADARYAECSRAGRLELRDKQKLLGWCVRLSLIAANACIALLGASAIFFD